MFIVDLKQTKTLNCIFSELKNVFCLFFKVKLLIIILVVVPFALTAKGVRYSNGRDLTEN